MSRLQEQVMRSLDGLSDAALLFLLDMIQKYIKPSDKNGFPQVSPNNEYTQPARKLGILKGQKLMADDYDFDEANEEIAKLFGVEI